MRHITIGLTIAAAALAAAALSTAGAGADATTPPQGLSLGKPALGKAAGPVSIGDAGDRFQIRVGAKKQFQVMTVNMTLAAGGRVGWHMHPGPAIVVVKSGSITDFEGAASHGVACPTHTFRAGQAFIEPPGDLHDARNTGRTPVKMAVTFLLPLGAKPLLDQPNPGTCPA